MKLKHSGTKGLEKFKGYNVTIPLTTYLSLLLAERHLRIKLSDYGPKNTGDFFEVEEELRELLKDLDLNLPSV